MAVYLSIYKEKKLLWTCLHCFREAFGSYTAKYSADYLVWLSLSINILCAGQCRDSSVPSYWPEVWLQLSASERKRKSEPTEKLSPWQTHSIGLWNEKVSNTGWLEGGMKEQRGNFKLSKAGIQSQRRPEDENHNNFSGALRNCLSQVCCCKIHNLKALPTYSSLNCVNKVHFFFYLPIRVLFFSLGSDRVPAQSYNKELPTVIHNQHRCPCSFPLPITLTGQSTKCLLCFPISIVLSNH